MNSIIKNAIRYVLLVFIQVFLIKNMVLFGLNTPYIYILFILLLPFETPNWLLFFLSFLIGLNIDVFNDTVGLHAAACVITAFVRVSVTSITVQKDNYDSDPEPTLAIMGFRWFSFYALVLTLVHHFFLLNFEVFRVSEIPTTISRVLLSSLFTLGLIFIAELLFFRKKQRK
ncbi:MAG TPA: rod shape-determining protein MreD [Pelobium sp.]